MMQNKKHITIAKENTMTVRTLAHTSRSNSRKPRKGLLAYLDLYAQRRALAKLDQAQLRDIGVSRAEAEAEVARPPWDAPRHWHK